jgi:2-methylcitrate dehydratase PrpD
MNESRELARYASGIRFEHLPAEVIAKVKDLVLDQLGIQMACSTLPWSKSVLDYVRDWGACVEESTIVACNLRTKAENAAFVNATYGHGFEIDDQYPSGSSHPGCIVVPSALALAERSRASGRDLITAIAAGYEVMGRINKAITPSCLLRGFHAPTSVSGPFGAAAAAGRMLGFDADLMLHALSIAGSHASGVTEYSHGGGSIKRMHAGIAAHGGVRSAFAAQKGITGPATILEGRHGFLKAFTDHYRIEELTDQLGDFRVVMGVGFKAYCACGGMHAGIDALLALKRRHDLRPDDVAEIVMGTTKQSTGHMNAEVTDITSAQFSVPFGLALTLMRGTNGFGDYTDETVRDPELLAVAAKIRMEVDPEVESEFPGRRSARVTVRLRNGITYSEKVDHCKGVPKNPFTRAEFERKFRDMAAVIADTGRVEAILRFVERLDEQSDLAPLIPLLAGAHH